MAKKTAEPFDPVTAFMSAYAANQRINQYLLESLDEAIWQVVPPEGKGRSIASIVAHMHNVRWMWLKAIQGDANLPAKLDPESVAPDQARTALDESYRAIAAVLEASLRGDGQVKGFKPDVASFFGYLVAHDAHHRGQIVTLARRLGHSVPKTVQFGMWEWGSRLKDIALH